mmetsp:Transcript_165808/g.293818  ORF Transcript_165808/g.293818 Transcript_165808/m.293818 type:complete len:104 (-) Transcript_165808:418-729(-)
MWPSEDSGKKNHQSATAATTPARLSAIGGKAVQMPVSGSKTSAEFKPDPPLKPPKTYKRAVAPTAAAKDLPTIICGTISHAPNWGLKHSAEFRACCPDQPPQT